MIEHGNGTAQRVVMPFIIEILRMEESKTDPPMELSRYSPFPTA